MLLRRGEVVGKRTGLARQIRGPLVIALAQGHLRLVEEALGVLERHLLGRLERAGLELRDAPARVADGLPFPVSEPLLLFGGQLRAKRRPGRAGGSPPTWRRPAGG